ncbi:DinB family protein [bacterium]|nr:DinB family protein [bacterium]
MLNEHFAQSFATAQMVMLANLQDVSHEDSLRPVGEAGNCINWLAGHLLHVADSLARELGAAQPVLSESESALYSMGSSPLSTESQCCQIDRLKEGLALQHKQISARLAAMSDEEYAAEIDPALLPVPLSKPNLASLITTLAFHQAYHSGQLGLARRALGMQSGLRI